MNVRGAIVAVVCTVLAGCVSGINRKEAEIHFDAAQRFDVQGDYVSAREHYGKALINARLAGADPATISMLTYNFGRTTGYTCHLDEAEKHLLLALEMEKSITGSESGISTKRQFELARFYFDQNQYEKATSYYAVGIPAVEKLGITESDPIGFAAALDEYAMALAQTGRITEAATAKQKAAQLRQQYPDVKPAFVPTRYKCKQ